MEALHDRIIVVKVPYNLSVKEEVKIYEKLIAQADFKNVHVSPHALYCAAIFAVLSRLKDSANKNLDIVTKMKLYNGESVEGFTSTDVANFKNEFNDEGMGGVSPRYIINRISSILSETGTTCITPIDVIRSIRDGFKSNAKLDAKEVSRLEDLLTKVIDEYSKIAKNDVQKAFFLNFEEEVSNLLSNYLDNVNAFLDGSKIENELGQQVEPHEKLMRSIEEKIQVTESGKRSFRQEISRKMARSASQNAGISNYKDHFKLREALEKQLFEERQDIIRLTVSTRITDETALRKLNVVIDTLCEKYGYTAESANKLLRYVSSVMART
jgi:serine protein kinase